jgi:ribosomal protein S18 acetylase RimI-like enzyme
MLIRRAVESDFDGIWPIFKAVIASGDSYVFAPDTTREEAFAYWFGAGITTYVAQAQDGAIMGMYKLLPNQPDRGSHVANAGFMIAPQYQGRGLGKTLGLHCLEAAKQAGYLAMQFNLVISTNQVAVALWQKLGFSIVGTLPKAFNHKQLGYVDAYVMYRCLADPPMTEGSLFAPRLN